MFPDSSAKSDLAEIDAIITERLALARAATKYDARCAEQWRDLSAHLERQGFAADVIEDARQQFNTHAAAAYEKHLSKLRRRLAH